MVAAGAAVGGLTVASGTAQADAASVSSTPLVVVDTRFAASRAFAAETGSGNVARIDGDITGLWYDRLDLLWRQEKVALAGLTEYGAFFCLERLALDRGLRAVFKGEHRRLSSGVLSHAISGPKAAVTQRVLTGLSDRDWAAQTARMAMAARSAGPISARFEQRTRAISDEPHLLISWVLEPKPGRPVEGGTA